MAGDAIMRLPPLKGVTGVKEFTSELAVELILLQELACWPQGVEPNTFQMTQHSAVEQSLFIEVSMALEASLRQWHSFNNSSRIHDTNLSLKNINYARTRVLSPQKEPYTRTSRSLYRKEPHNHTIQLGSDWLEMIIEEPLLFIITLYIPSCWQVMFWVLYASLSFQVPLLPIPGSVQICSLGKPASSHHTGTLALVPCHTVYKGPPPPPCPPGSICTQICSNLFIWSSPFNPTSLFLDRLNSLLHVHIDMRIICL